MPSSSSARCLDAPPVHALLIILTIGLGPLGCERSDNREQFQALSERPLRLQSLSRDVTLESEPVRALSAIDPQVSESPSFQLGKLLFHDTRLSGDMSLSCASCHDLQSGGDDGRPQSVGVRGQLGKINSPTVLNSGFNFRQFWDARAKSLTEQALFPVVNPEEMGAVWSEVLDRLSADQQVMALYEQAFNGAPLTALRVTESIASFERSLVTPSPFDRFLQGDRRAISENAAAGYELFKDYGCVSCHQGVNLGGNLMQHFGAFQSIDIAYQRSIARQRAEDGQEPALSIPVFKVPTLRNIALTAPYFHTGNVESLREAVRVMAAVQLARTLQEWEIDLLVAFLESLTGEVPEYAKPDLQVSGAQ